MRRGSTPSVELTIPGIDLTGAAIRVAIAQDENLLVKTGTDVSVYYDAVGDKTTLTVPYTQQQTLKFSEGRAQIQVRWVFSDGRADGTSVKTVAITPVLEDGVIEYA